VSEVAKALEVSEATYDRWRAQFGGMKADDVKRLRELERENQTLKRIVANKELEMGAACQSRSTGPRVSRTCRRCRWKVRRARVSGEHPAGGAK
jgi:hypothetical protein